MSERNEIVDGQIAAAAYVGGEYVVCMNARRKGTPDQWESCEGMSIDEFKNHDLIFMIKSKPVKIDGFEYPRPRGVVIDNDSVILMFSSSDQAAAFIAAFN